MPQNDILITAAEFNVDSTAMLLGTSNGKIKMYSLANLDSEPTEFSISSSPVTSIQRINEGEDLD